MAPTPLSSSSAPADAAAALAPFAEDIEIVESEAQQAPRRQPTGRDMLINVVEGEEVRIAIVRRGLLEELYMERSSTESHIGNIYKGRVTNVEPSIQAAFIDFGIGKNGFLHISDLHPQYFPKKKQPRMPMGRRQPPQYRPQPVQQAPVPGEGPAETPAESSLARQQAAEYPAVQMDENGVPEAFVEVNDATDAPLDSSSTQESPVEQASEPNGDSAIAEAPANDIGPGTETHGGPAEESGVPASPQGEVATNGEDAADAEEVAEDEADFGSAYGADFGDDDDTGEGDEDQALDDGHMKPMEKVGRKTPRRDRPPIQQCLRRGQEVIVQVTKEGIGTKGPTLTSYISCPGRYLVMMPGMAQLGVSRKIEDLDQRRELKRILQDLNPPRNLGFIIRTAGTEVAKKELQGDLNYLVRMWKVIANRIRTHKAPVELYEESDLVIRTIRDVFNDQIDRIIVDNEQVASRVRDFLSIVDPRAAGMVELYTGTMPLFQKFGVEREIEKINSRRVELNNGGSLVIDSTEALVAIDVNSGRYREMRDAELTAFNMNKEALKEVVRQLRLRDLGGVIVIDFIDMREERHKRAIEDMLRKELENDRAKTKVLRMSQFCMIEMTRQRVRPSLKRSIYMDCPHCHGSALIKTPESVSLDVMRRLAAGMTRLDVARLEVKAYPTVANFLLNRKRKAIVELEEKTGKRINITPDEKLAGDQIVIQAIDVRGVILNVLL
jgi:Rne/Rng family ribonuclease